MTDGVYVVRDGVAYRATAARGFCNAERCDLFRAGTCDAPIDKINVRSLPCDYLWQMMMREVGPVSEIHFKRAEEEEEGK